MEYSVILKILLYLILFIITVILIIELLMIRRGFNLSKKFSHYTIKSKQSLNSNSIFDSLILKFNTLLKKTTSLLSKSKFISKYSNRYEKYIKVDDIEKIKPVDFISIKIFISLIILLFYISYQIIKSNKINLVVCFIILLIGYFLYDFYLMYDYNKKKKLIEEDLLKAIVIMNNAFKIGKNILESIEIVMNELDGPISDEFKKIYKDINYGLSLETAFLRFSDRTKIDDVKYITSSLTLLNKTGGNIVKVFDSVESSFFSNKKLRKELKSLTGASNFLYRFLLVVPIVFTLIISSLNSSYFIPFFTTKLGIIVLCFIMFLYILYIIVIKKITRLDV